MDDFDIRNVLEDDEAHRKIKLGVAQRREIDTVGVVQLYVVEAGEPLSRLGDHLTADVDSVYVAKDFCQWPRHAAYAAADLKHRHRLRIAPAGNALQVVEDVMLGRLAARVLKVFF